MDYEPMLPVKAEEPFDDPNYIFEPKIDGHRLLLHRKNGVARLYTRFGNACTRQYPELHGVPTDDELVLDGEVCRIGPDGSADYGSVMERFRMTRATRIQAAAVSEPVHMVVFDLLQRNGKDLRGLPLTERKQILRDSLGVNNRFSHSLYLPEEGARLFSTVRERRMEGIVAKRKDSPYVGGRSENWQTIINYTYAVVLLAGYRKNQFGWLVSYNGCPAGVIERFVPAAGRQLFGRIAAGLKKTGEDRNYVYVEPRIKARVRFRKWTEQGWMLAPELVDLHV